MNQYQQRVCVEFDNVLWMCDGCLASFRKQRLEPSNESIAEGLNNANPDSRIERIVHQLQSECATLNQSFAELKKSLNCSKQTVNESGIPSTSTPHRSLDNGSTSSVNLNDTSRLQMGSNSEITSVRSRRFWIFFTRIAKHVSADSIRDMVCNSLQSTDIPEVVKLVPRWSNIETLRYVSFKVGVDWQYKDKAVMDSTWPTGLLFREFEHREFSYWEP